MKHRAALSAVALAVALAAGSLWHPPVADVQAQAASDPQVMNALLELRAEACRNYCNTSYRNCLTSKMVVNIAEKVGAGPGKSLKIEMSFCEPWGCEDEFAEDPKRTVSSKAVSCADARTACLARCSRIAIRPR